MTKTQIELLMMRDVDDVSDVAVHHPPKQLGVTLKNAAALLCREKGKDDIEERLFLFKLLRFVQAALSATQAHVTADVACKLFASARLVMKRSIASDVNRAARDMLSVLLTEKTTKALLQNRFVSTEELLAVYQYQSDEPRGYSINFRTLAALKAKHRPTSKVQPVETKVGSKPKRLIH